MVKKVIELLGGVGKILKALDKRAKDFRPPHPTEFTKRGQLGVNRKSVKQDQKTLLGRGKRRRVSVKIDRRVNRGLVGKKNKDRGLAKAVFGTPGNRRGPSEFTEVEDAYIFDLQQKAQNSKSAFIRKRSQKLADEAINEATKRP
jgi:hypothetical protein